MGEATPYSKPSPAMRKMTSNHSPTNQEPNLLFIVLSGPSGAGKDAVLKRMKESGFPLKFITTVTTRPKRVQEIEDVDYHFVSVDRFQEMIARNELLEWANVYGNWYGVPKQPVKAALEAGQDVVVKTDVQGAATLKKLLPQAVLIFLAPPQMEELKTRLSERHTESSHDLSLRLEKAAGEIGQLPAFDYMVWNPPGEIDRAVADIRSIIRAEKCRVNHRVYHID